MELSAHDIHEKQFHDAWRGYNQEEVDDFLDRVAEQFDLLQRENTAVLTRVRELEQALTTSRETEEMLKKTLVSAQQAAEEAIAKAQKKADALLADAEERAARANEETRQRLSTIDAEIKRKALDADREHTVRRRESDASVERLRAFESDLKRRLKTFLEQQAHALEALTESEAPVSETTRPGASRSPAPPERREGVQEANGTPTVRTSSDQGDVRRVDTPGAPHASGEPLRLDDDDAEVDAPQRRSVRSLFMRDDS
ncbi:MAG: DivIVA domain-containing protein [Actinomycetota bacterium]